MNVIKSFATAASTQPKQGSFDTFTSRKRPLYPGGPWVAPVGFGGYRIGLTPYLGYPTCSQALEQALSQGLNLVDTSPNYGDGQSETLIGQTLRLFQQEKGGRRDALVLVSKVGYIQGQNLEAYRAQENPPPSYAFGEAFAYSIHPDFIVDQLAKSCERLGVSTLDVYLLHNPEYILKRLELDGVPLTKAREIFYAEIAKAFSCLQTLVNQHKIKAYGVSANGFAVSEQETTHVSLPRLWEIANSLTTNHSFKVVQLPLNWIEMAPLFYEIENLGESFVSHASRLGLGVLVNRPFNAMLNNSLLRLTRPLLSAEERLHITPEMQEGLKNWESLASDLERLAKGLLADVPGYSEATLSQLVIASLVWIPGVSAVLCGMRRPAYVDDAREALRLPSLPHSLQYLHQIYESLEFHDSR